MILLLKEKAAQFDKLYIKYGSKESLSLGTSVYELLLTKILLGAKISYSALAFSHFQDL